MKLLSKEINKVIFLLLHYLDKDISFLYEKYEEVFKNYTTDMEKQIINNRYDINIKMENINFLLTYVPFTENFILFLNIYYIFKKNYNQIEKLILINNIREIFHYIKGIYYRSIYGYYNEMDDIKQRHIDKLEFNIKKEQLLDNEFSDLNIRYIILFNINEKLKEYKNDKKINLKQNNCYILKKMFTN